MGRAVRDARKISVATTAWRGGATLQRSGNRRGAKVTGDDRLPGRRRAPEQRPAITLADVARVAGVSEITVSRILRNSGPISATTRAKVMAAVDTVGYVPNRIAGTLASATSNLMGVIIPSLSNIVFPEVLQGIHAALATSGFQPVVGVTDYDPGVEEGLVRALLAWKPAAMIVAGFDHTDTTRRTLEQSRIRVAQLMDIDAVPIDIAVGLSHRSAGRDTGRYLLERGYRRFGYVGHDWNADRRARLRWEGLCAALSEAGLALTDQALFDGPSSTQAGRAMLATLLARTPSLEVVVFSNDDMAVGGVFHCHAHGIAPKRDLGLFGFNGLDIGQSLPVPLSTVRSNRYLIGKLAVATILEHPDRQASPIIIDTGYEILEGGTA
jgi:LacI family gluconate utilization system Gnt-I transcriptional repressor